MDSDGGKGGEDPFEGSSKPKDVSEDDMEICVSTQSEADLNSTSAERSTNPSPPVYYTPEEEWHETNEIIIRNVRLSMCPPNSFTKIDFSNYFNALDVPQEEAIVDLQYIFIFHLKYGKENAEEKGATHCEVELAWRLHKKYGIATTDLIKSGMLRLNHLFAFNAVNISHILATGRGRVFGVPNGLPRGLAFSGGLNLIPQGEIWAPLVILWKMWRESISPDEVRSDRAGYYYMTITYRPPSHFPEEDVMKSLGIRPIPAAKVYLTLGRILISAGSSCGYSDFKTLFPQYANEIWDFFRYHTYTLTMDDLNTHGFQRVYYRADEDRDFNPPSTDLVSGASLPLSEEAEKNTPPRSESCTNEEFVESPSTGISEDLKATQIDENIRAIIERICILKNEIQEGMKISESLQECTDGDSANSLAEELNNHLRRAIKEYHDLRKFDLSALKEALPQTISLMQEQERENTVPVPRQIVHHSDVHHSSGISNVKDSELLHGQKVVNSSASDSDGNPNKTWQSSYWPAWDRRKQRFKTVFKKFESQRLHSQRKHPEEIAADELKEANFKLWFCNLKCLFHRENKIREIVSSYFERNPTACYTRVPLYSMELPITKNFLRSISGGLNLMALDIFSEPDLESPPEQRISVQSSTSLAALEDLSALDMNRPSTSAGLTGRLPPIGGEVWARAAQSAAYDIDYNRSRKKKEVRSETEDEGFSPADILNAGLVKDDKERNIFEFNTPEDDFAYEKRDRRAIKHADGRYTDSQLTKEPVYRWRRVTEEHKRRPLRQARVVQGQSDSDSSSAEESREIALKSGEIPSTSRGVYHDMLRKKSTFLPSSSKKREQHIARYAPENRESLLRGSERLSPLGLQKRDSESVVEDSATAISLSTGRGTCLKAAEASPTDDERGETEDDVYTSTDDQT